MPNFHEPGVLYLLALTGGLGVFLVSLAFFKLWRRPSKTRGSRYAPFGRMAFWVYVCVIAAASIIALARPFTQDAIPVVRRGCIDVVFIVDASFSMAASDVGMQRVERAKQEVLELVGSDVLQERCDRVALLTFDRTVKLRSPLTRDFSLFGVGVAGIDILRSLDERDSSTWGTDLPQALRFTFEVLASQGEFEEEYFGVRSSERPKVVFLMSDGIDESEIEGALEIALRSALKEDATIYTVAIGTKTPRSLLSVFHNSGAAEHMSDYSRKGIEEDLRGYSARVQTAMLEMVAARTGGKSMEISGEHVSAFSFMRSAIANHRPITTERVIIAGEQNDDLWWYVLSGTFLFIGFALLVI